jgi:IMP dehydrogenase/GMP reductase
MRILEEALTFDDVLLVPAYSDVLPREVDLSTQLTRRIRLNLPVVSAAMDTVTEARLAIAIAQEGGIGIVHKSMTIEAQAREVDRVKKFESGVVLDPITVSPDATIRQVLELTKARGISGMPVVRGNQVVGIVTSRDLRFETHLDAPVSSVMTPQERLVTRAHCLVVPATAHTQRYCELNDDSKAAAAHKFTHWIPNPSGETSRNSARRLLASKNASKLWLQMSNCSSPSSRDSGG